MYRELEWYKDDDLVFRSPRRLARPVLERRNLATLRRHVSEFSPDIVNWWAMGGMPLSLIESVRRMGLPAIGMISDEWMIYGQEVDAWLAPFRRFWSAHLDALERHLDRMDQPKTDKPTPSKRKTRRKR